MRTRAAAVVLGVLADSLWGDPARFHPVAGLGRGSAWVEARLYRDSRAAGLAHAAICTAAPTAVAIWVQRRAGRPVRTAVLATSLWIALGGTSLVREADRMSALLARDDLPAARAALGALCSRDATTMDRPDLARATVESIAENTSDAAVAPLVWAALLGTPGVVAYRAINTLDAMVGYRSERYRRFGWASARLDDLANLLPARLTALLTVALAPVVGGDVRQAWRVWRRDGSHHPSPNAGQCEAAFAGALGRTIGGTNTYGGEVEERGLLGDGPAPDPADIARAARLSRAVVFAAAATAIGLSWRRR